MRQKHLATNTSLLTTASFWVFGAAFKLLNFHILGGGQQAPSVGGKFGKTDSGEGGIPLEFLTISNIDEIKFIDNDSREKFYSDHNYQNKLHYDMETLMRKHGVKSMSMTIDPFISYSRLLELCQPICDQS